MDRKTKFKRSAICAGVRFVRSARPGSFISLQSRRFLTKTRRYINRGRHLEKQRKRLRRRGGGREEGRGGETHQPLP